MKIVSLSQLFIYLFNTNSIFEIKKPKKKKTWLISAFKSVQEFHVDWTESAAGFVVAVTINTFYRVLTYF